LEKVGKKRKKTVINNAFEDESFLEVREYVYGELLEDYEHDDRKNASPVRL
jgi:hypothetical protein